MSQTRADAPPTALSLGTSFYRLGKFGPEDEAGVYAQFHNDARRLDYDVIWKSHPRAGRALIEEPGGGVTEPFDQSLPIEFLPLVRNIALSGSISSTALLTLKKAYGIPYVVLGRALAERLSLPWLSSLHQYADETIPARQEVGR